LNVPELEQELAQGHAALAQIKVRLELARSTLQRWTVSKRIRQRGATGTR